MPATEPTEAAVVRFLDKVQRRDLSKDTGHGYRSARQVGEAVGLDKLTARTLLQSMAESGLIRREDFSNGHAWRSVKPLPWELGGELEKERALWDAPLTLMVQSARRERGTLVYRDEKGFPESLRQRAIDYVNSENKMSQARRDEDYANSRHFSPHYTSPPTYRLVSLVPEAAR